MLFGQKEFKKANINHPCQSRELNKGPLAPQSGVLPATQTTECVD